MARSKFGSPRLDLTITAENYETATKSKSGGCLIVDAIKRQYPQFTGVTADMATIRVSDPEVGMRYTYLTPPPAQHLLLAFDQGWSQYTDTLRIRSAVKITPMLTQPGREARREERLAELEDKEAGGTLTPRDSQALTKMRKRGTRPTSQGKTEVKVDDAHGHQTVIYGGTPLPTGKKFKNPNLLAGRNRHYGAKLADPGDVFREAVDEGVAHILTDPGVFRDAVEQEVARKLAEMEKAEE